MPQEVSQPQLAGVELARVRAEALTSHYQKTFDLTLRFWDRRNQLFLILVSVLAVAALLTLVQTRAVAFLYKWLGEIGAMGKEAAAWERADVELAVKMLIAFLVVAVFYLMANLYHRSTTILNYYTYLAQLEIEIRDELRIEADKHAFSRESTFYRERGQPTSSIIGKAYKAIVLALLIAFFILRLASDYREFSLPLRFDLATVLTWGQNNFLLPLDIVVGVLTAIMFWGYATQSAKAFAGTRSKSRHASPEQ